MSESSCLLSLQCIFILISLWRSPFLSKLARILSFLLLLLLLHLNRRKWFCNIFVNFPIFLHHWLAFYFLRNWRHLLGFCLHGIEMFFLQIDTKQCLKIVPFYPHHRLGGKALVDQLVQYSKFPGDFYSPLLLEFLSVCTEGMHLV